MFKNWSKKKKTTAIVVVVGLLLAGFFFGWFGEKFSYKGLTARNADGVLKQKATKKTDCVGGYLTYAGVQSNIPCTNA